jgi:uncharacterized protein (TIGR03067 family)
VNFFRSAARSISVVYSLEVVMKCCAAFLVTFVSFTAAGADNAKEKAIQQERERLQGKWKLTSVERDGKARPLGFDFFVVIKNDKWTTEKKETDVPTFQIDPTQNPKTIDITMTGLKGDGGKDLVEKGIYKLDKDTLTICISEPIGEPRPKEFKSTEGHVIRVYKRAEK